MAVKTEKNDVTRFFFVYLARICEKKGIFVTEMRPKSCERAKTF